MLHSAESMNTSGKRLDASLSNFFERIYWVIEFNWLTNVQDLLKIYKVTRNGMLGSDYSTKFSPWLASGSLSPRFVYEEVKYPKVYLFVIYVQIM